MQLAEDNYRLDSCKNHGAYIKKAIRFYSGYLDTEHAENYLPRALARVLDGKLGALGDRVGRWHENGSGSKTSGVLAGDEAQRVAKVVEKGLVELLPLLCYTCHGYNLINLNLLIQPFRLDYKKQR